MSGSVSFGLLTGWPYTGSSTVKVVVQCKWSNTWLHRHISRPSAWLASLLYGTCACLYGAVRDGKLGQQIWELLFVSCISLSKIARKMSTFRLGGGNPLGLWRLCEMHKINLGEGGDNLRTLGAENFGSWDFSASQGATKWVLFTFKVNKWGSLQRSPGPLSCENGWGRGREENRGEREGRDIGKWREGSVDWSYMKRPRRTWLRTIEQDLRPLNIGLVWACHRAQDRERWKRTVETATLQAGACSWWWWWFSMGVEWVSE